jgi:hypothetical protein
MIVLGRIRMMRFSMGIPRIRRTVQRYCSNGTLDAHRFTIPYGEKYLITPESLERHIQYILEARSATADHGQPRLDEAPVAPEKSNDVGAQVGDPVQESTMVSHGQPWPAMASAEPVAPAVTPIEIVEMLKGENKFLKDQIAVKDAQLAVKDRGSCAPPRAWPSYGTRKARRRRRTICSLLSTSGSMRASTQAI